MGQLWKRDVKCSDSLFVNEIKLHKESYKTLKDVKEMITDK